MLLFLDASLEQLDLNNAQDSAAIENLLGAIFSGCHMLAADSKVLDSLLRQRAHLSPRSQSVLIDTRNRQPQYGALFSQLKTKVHVCADITASIRILEHQWKIPLKSFSDISKVNRALLLTEDQADAEIYFFAAEHFMVLNKIRGVAVAGRPGGGGGSRIVNHLEKIVSTESDICLCITDSDRFSPAAIPKQSSRDCTKIAADTAWTVRHRNTDVRELENLLPHKFIEQTIESRGFQQNQTWEQIQAKFKIDKTLASFSDLKEGASLRWVLKMPAGTPDRKYWINVANKLGVTPANSDCMKNDACNAADENCNCQLISGLGQKLSEIVLTWLKETSKHKSLECVDTTIDTEWLEIGEEVFEWCCAWQPKRC